MRYVEKAILLRTLDHLWREHLILAEDLQRAGRFNLGRRLLFQFEQSAVASRRLRRSTKAMRTFIQVLWQILSQRGLNRQRA
jgi:hypothetical protein